MNENRVADLERRNAELEEALRRIWHLAQHAPVARQAEKTLGAIQREVSAHVKP
jgi:hypothetical protein